MFSLGWGESDEAWKWRRRLLAGEEELQSECCVLLSPIVLHADVNDMWIWQLHASSRYNVTNVYNYLTARDQPLDYNQPKTIWRKEVLLKFNIYA